MSAYGESRYGVKARKTHRCALCGERINVAELHDTRTGLSDDGWCTMRMHPECQRFEEHLNRNSQTELGDWYEDISDPAFDRKDALAFVAPAADGKDPAPSRNQDTKA